MRCGSVESKGIYHIVTAGRALTAAVPHGQGGGAGGAMEAG